MGKNFENWFKFIINDCGLELLPDGVIKNVIGEESKDVDLVFMDKKLEIIYYRELKSNLELDTEKLPATYKKIKIIEDYYKTQYPGYKIDSSLLTWAVYNKSPLPTKYNSKIKKCESNSVHVTFPEDLFKMINADISGKDYYDFFRELGKKVKEAQSDD